MNRAFFVLYRESHWSGWLTSDTEWDAGVDAHSEAKHRIDSDGIYCAAVCEYDRDADYHTPVISGVYTSEVK